MLLSATPAHLCDAFVWRLSRVILPLMLLLATVFSVRHSAAQPFENVWRIADPGACAGCRGSSLVDLNGDGRDELITTGGASDEYQAAYALVYERTGEGFELQWVSAWSEWYQLSGVFAADHGFGQDGPELYVLHGNGTLEAYDGQNYALLWRKMYAPNGIAVAALIADIDHDGRLEVVIAADYSVRAYDLESAELEWELAESWSKSVHAGDIDADGDLEVVISAGYAEEVGYVLDGRTGSVEWTYYGGFGRSIHLRDVTGDGVADIVGQSLYGPITSFDVVQKTPVWQIDIEAYNQWPWIDFRDVDRDGTDEILVALAHGEVRAYTVLPTRELLWTKQLSEDGQLTLFDVGDTNGDGNEDFVARKGAYQPRVVSGSLDDGLLVWQSERRTPPFHVSVGDTDGDQVPEVAVVNARPDRHMYYTIDRVDGQGEVTSSRDVDWLPYSTILPRALTDLDQDGRGEMIFMIDGVMGIIDAVTGRLIREKRIGAEGMVGGTILALGDVDGDGFEEIAVADGGKVHLMDGRTLEITWSSIDIQQQIQRVWITNVDEDPAGEIVFLNHTLQAYDGITGTLEWQMPLDARLSAIDVGDVNGDGRLDAVVGTYDGAVLVFDGATATVIAERQVYEGDIWSIRLANVDDSEDLEIVMAAGSLRVLRITDLETLWESEPLGPLHDRLAGLHVVDVDTNKQMDILYATAAGVFRFENQVEYRDITLPFIVSTFPKQLFAHAGVDVVPHFDFSEAIVTPENSVVRLTADGEALSANLQYDAAKRRLSVVPSSALPPNASIEVAITSHVTDEAGLPLDGNRNGRVDASPTDDFVLRFSTGSSVDAVGPIVYLDDADLGEIWQGIVIDLRATVADTSSVANSLVSYVEVFVDEYGDAGSGIALEPLGGRFDSPMIDVAGRIRTEFLGEGEHHIFIRARDATGNWGEATTARFSVRSWQHNAWTTYGGEPGRSGSSDVTVRPPLSAKWTVPIEEMGYSTPPIVAGGRVFLGWSDAVSGFSISAYEIATGDELWRYIVGVEGLATGLTYAYGRIFAHVSANYEGHRLLAIDAENGTALWDLPTSNQTSGHWFGPAVVHDGVVVVGGDFRLSAYDAMTGDLAWRVTESHSDVWMPAAADGIIYSFWEGHLVAYEVATGARMWRVPVPLYASFGWESTVVVDPHSDLVFVSSYAEIFAVDRSTREIVWHYEGTLLAPPAVDAEQVYITSPGFLLVLDKTSGGVSHEVELVQDIRGAPFLMGDYVYIQATNGVSAVGKTSGSVEWSADIGGQIAAADGHLFVSRSSSYFEQYVGGLHAYISADRVDIDDGPEIPLVMAIHGNYPNPFNPMTTIAFSLAESSRVRMIVFDVVGREIARLIDDSRLPGSYEVVFDAADLPSGLYFVRLESANKVLTRSMTLIK